MKNALLLLSIWVGIIVAAYVMVYWDGEIEQPISVSVSESAESTYVDSAGRFSLIFPSAWDLEEMETSVLLSDPSGDIEVAVSSVEEAIPEVALLRALGVLDGDPAREAVEVEEISAIGAAERAVRIIGPMGDDAVSYGLGYLYEGQTIVLLVSGSADALEDRAADLERIEAGIGIPATDTEPGDQGPPVVEL